MAKKTYRTFSLKKLYTYVRNEEGEKVPIVFQGGIQVDSTAIFSTTSEMIQKGLESAPGFNRDYYLESEREDNPAVAPEPAPKAEEVAEETSATAAEEVAEVSDGDGLQKVKVADKSEAVEWLKEHYPEEGYTGVKLRTMAAVNEAGKKHGVVFEITD